MTGSSGDVVSVGNTLRRSVGLGSRTTAVGTLRDLSSAPAFSDLIASLRSATTDRTCIYFDLEFVSRILKQTFQRYQIDPLNENFVELRHYMAAYQGDWSPYDGRYQLPTLPGSDYRAPGDCKIMLDQIERMATDIPLLDQGNN
jgi:hypothetical protein